MFRTCSRASLLGALFMGLLLGALGWSCAGISHAQERTPRRPPTVGCVDVQRVFRQAPLTRQLAAELRQWRAAQEQEFERRQAELIALRDQLIAAAKGGQPDGHSQLLSLNDEVTGLRTRLQAEYGKRVLQNDRAVYARICRAVEVVMEREGVELVLQAPGQPIEADDLRLQALQIRSMAVLGAAPSLDLTDLVLETLEETP